MEQQLDLLQRASNEIKSLRERTNYQSVRLQMFDDMMLLLRTPPGYGSSQGMSPDLVYEIDKFVDKTKTVQPSNQ